MICPLGFDTFFILNPDLEEKAIATYDLWFPQNAPNHSPSPAYPISEARHKLSPELDHANQFWALPPEIFF